MIIKRHIKASSLMNAVFICLIISIFCGCLVLIAHYQNLLNQKLYLQEDLIGRNNGAFNYYLNNTDALDIGDIKELDVFDDGIKSFVEKKSWGFYEILISKTIFSKDTLTKIALIGRTSDSKNPIAIFVTNYDKPLKLSGTAKISGLMKIPYGKTEQAYLNGSIGNAIQIIGQQLKSESTLPKLDNTIVSDSYNYETVLLENIKDGSLINNFDKETIILNLDGVDVLNDIVCKGNIIIKSNSRLAINETATLNDILIVAPEVIFNTGFRGNVQVIAEKVVKLEDNVHLKYPSSIYVKNDLDSVTVTINKNCILVGGIVIEGTTYIGSLKRKLIIDKEAKVVGTIYNFGQTQMQGELIGTIFTDRFFLKTESSNYENVIFNGTINRDSLPKDFIELPLFEGHGKTSSHAIIKEF